MKNKLVSVKFNICIVILCIFLAFIILVLNFTFNYYEILAQTSTASKSKKVPIEITGDLFEMEPDNTYVITGNVRVYQGNRTIKCEKGTYNEKTGIVKAFLNVEILDDRFKLTCQRVDSHMKENFSLFSGGVVVYGKNFKANSERAFYYEKEEKAVLVGNPIAKSYDEPPNEVTGERIIYYLKNDRMEVINDVKVDIYKGKIEDKNNFDHTHITGNKLCVLEDGRYQVSDNLRVFKKDMVLYADRGIYDETNEVTEAFGNVKIETSKYTLTAGYVKHFAKEDRTLATIMPKLIQIVDKKKRNLNEEKNLNTNLDSNDELEQTNTTGESELKQTKKIVNKDKVILTANEIESFENSTHIVAKGNVILLQFPYIGQEGTEGVEINSKVECEIMDIFTEEGKMIAKQNVVLTSKDITAYGDTAIYYENEDRLDIEGNARAIQKRGKGLEDNDIKGKKITYFASTERVIVKEPLIKFYQTSKEEEKLPEIEKDTAPVKIKRKKDNLSSNTSEVTVTNIKTSEVNVINTNEVILKNNKTEPISTSNVEIKQNNDNMIKKELDNNLSSEPKVRLKINEKGKIEDLKLKEK